MGEYYEWEGWSQVVEDTFRQIHKRGRGNNICTGMGEYRERDREELYVFGRVDNDDHFASFFAKNGSKR